MIDGVDVADVLRARAATYLQAVASREERAELMQELADRAESEATLRAYLGALNEERATALAFYILGMTLLEVAGALDPPP